MTTVLTVIDQALTDALTRGYSPRVIDSLLDIRNAAQAALHADVLERIARNS